MWTLSWLLNNTKAALHGTHSWLDDKVNMMTPHNGYIEYTIYRCGPMTRYWCMRFEHNYFKDLAHRTKQFKNIGMSLSHCHHQLVCYQLNKSESLVKCKMYFMHLPSNVLCWYTCAHRPSMQSKWVGVWWLTCRSLFSN